MIRVFIALNLPQDIKSSLSLLQKRMQGAKWTPTENLHLTIRFIGEVSLQQLKIIKEELREISFLPFKIKLKDLGHFSGRSGPKVIWVGVEPLDDLFELRKKVDDALTRANIPREKSNFHPHVTVAKLKGTTFESLAKYLQGQMGFYTREMEFKEMVLLSSKTREECSIYSLEETFIF